ncbi:phage tail tape measure protein [Streptomyces sp. HNM0663]|uniref:Phage tail tape measure protein n=1 Tax=Streptomyces chengmaiensis TaxID=3040919 RepID=A0ABT6HUD8_9ACTN|nr:phage tail tape measure protein [Streptomyces chengmaiensis]MDH2392310.1 phage tail tape measure protein [Streptomyces chengmaiensis]
MAEEVGVAFVRLVPSMRGFGPEASRALNDATAQPAAAAGQEAGGRFGDAFKTALLGAGLLAGAALVGGIGEALDQGRITAKMGAQLGATTSEAKRYGQIAGQLFAAGVTANFQEAADAVRATMAAGLLPPDATNAQINSIATNVADLASTFDLELGQTAAAVGQLMKNGMAPDAKAALDLVAAGLSGTDARADDALDTITEYGTIFKTVGVSGQTAMGLIRQGLQAGARDTDKIADAVKEFSLKATEDSEAVQDAFKDLGLSGKEIGADVAAGGTRAENAIGTVLDKLREMPATTARANVIKELFGGPGEDLGASLFALNVDKARASMDGASGSADALGDGLRDNAGARLTEFKNGLQQAFVEVLGNKVIPVLEDFASWARDNPNVVKGIAVAIAGVLVPALVLMAVNATVAAATTVTAWVTAGAAAVSSAGTQTAAGARVAGAWVLMAGRALVQAGRMAASWFIAMGPIGWVIGAIIALGLLIFANWDKIKKWTGQAWDWVWSKIQSVGKAILGFILGMPLVRFFLQHWDRIRSGTASKVLGFISWVRGIPGRILRAIGSLRSLLYNKGMDLISGLWNGIKSMGGWLKSKLISFARSKIPGPIAKALGIASPSKVMAREIGRWIPAGIQQGIESGTADVSASTQLAAAVMLPGHAGQTPRTAPAAGTTVVIDGTAMPRALLQWLRHSVRIDGQGSVQTLLGQPRKG